MQHYFDIHPSRVQPGLSLGLHLLVAIAVAASVEPPAMALLSMMLIALLAWRETSRLLGQGRVRLGIDPRRASIELIQGEQPYFYGKYKVYATRWFAILKLIDNRKNRTLILHSDRFDSIHSYRLLRRLLANPVHRDVA